MRPPRPPTTASPAPTGLLTLTRGAGIQPTASPSATAAPAAAAVTTTRGAPRGTRSAGGRRRPDGAGPSRRDEVGRCPLRPPAHLVRVAGLDGLVGAAVEQALGLG